MRIRRFQSILDECIAALEQGETVEACLKRYPKHASRLRPLLQLAARVRQTPPAKARPWAQATAWSLVRQRAADLRSGRRRWPRLHANYGLWLRPLAIGMALFAALIAGGGATAVAAQNALPDSPIYRVKLLTDDVYLWFVFDDTREAQILLDQSNERVDEMIAMVQKGKDIPKNVLSDMHGRNARVLRLLEKNPDDLALRQRVLAQAELQEERLLSLWEHVSSSARQQYTQVVAQLHNARLGVGSFVRLDPAQLAQGILNIEGVAEPLGDGTWSVGGIRIAADERTINLRELRAGVVARFVVGIGSDNRLHALKLTPLQANKPGSGALVSGHVEEITGEGIRVAGQWIPMSADPLLRAKLKQGERVEIAVETAPDGGLVAVSVSSITSSPLGDTPPFTLEGTIEGDVSAGSEWAVGGLRLEIPATATVDATAGDARSGARALVEVSTQDGRLRAQRVRILASDSPAESVHLIGVYQGTTPDGLWLVSGLPVLASADTERPAPGSLVAVDAERREGGFEADTIVVIESGGDRWLVRFEGTVTAVSGRNWTLEIGNVRVPAEAIVIGESAPAARVLGWARPTSDGTLEAVYVRVLDRLAAAETPAPEFTPASAN
jgi:hypothetical protein